MYSRVLLPQQISPIENGKPIQGTWTTAFEKVDLLDIKKPYPVPLPRSILNLRVKEWQSFAIQNDEVCLFSNIANFKFISFAEVFFLDKSSGESLRLFRVFPLSYWRLPSSLNNSYTGIDTHDFSFRIHNWLDCKSIKIDLNIGSNFNRAAFTAQIEFDLDIKKMTPMSVNLLLSDTRCYYAYKGISAIRGRIVWGSRRIILHRASSIGLFRDHKGYLPYMTRTMSCAGFGFDSQQRMFGFSLAENQAREPSKNNENALWLEGALTPLPPVRITQAKEDEWNIQDLEGMVDLTFKFVEEAENTFGIIFFNIEHQTPIGRINGMLQTKDGERLQIRNLWGFAEKFNFRL
ncbi:hypothetical protein FACS1894190_09950 [Spirochaetia bacterium]|nr:hypothetical protein FACS1894190_09950 [Spirochaetia bacterium]